MFVLIKNAKQLKRIIIDLQNWCFELKYYAFVYYKTHVMIQLTNQESSKITVKASPKK